MIDGKLKPCPFCGSEEPIVMIDGRMDKRIICNKGKGGCGAEIGWYVSIIELRKAWNGRKRK